MDDDLIRLLGGDLDDPQESLARDLVREDMDLIASLRRERSRQGIERKDVAARLGVSVQTVADFERLGGDPRLSSIRRYALALGVRITHQVELPQSR